MSENRITVRDDNLEIEIALGNHILISDSNTSIFKNWDDEDIFTNELLTPKQKEVIELWVRDFRSSIKELTTSVRT
jgi:hypothetical protein